MLGRTDFIVRGKNSDYALGPLNLFLFIFFYTLNLLRGGMGRYYLPQQLKTGIDVLDPLIQQLGGTGGVSPHNLDIG